MSGADGLGGLLAVLQLSDSAFPSGRYTLSHGLETFTQEGLLERPCAPAALAELLGDCIRFGVARSAPAGGASASPIRSAKKYKKHFRRATW